MKILKYIQSMVSMKFVKYHFYDSISGKVVNIYIDKFGDEYMSYSRFSLFRVKRK